jgi:hypothetical protein
VERGQRCKAAGCVDPLAALEAAERRLLEAGGWTVAGAAAVRELTAGVSEVRLMPEPIQPSPAFARTPGKAASLPTVADVEPIAADMTATPPSIREPAEPDDRGSPRTWGTWQAPPRRRRNITSTARLPGAGKVHLTIDLDDAGQPCAIWVEVHKEGSIVRGMLDAAAALASQGLQHGASIHEVASRLIGVRFEPDGAVEGHATVRECLSIVDLLGRMIEAEFPKASREDVLADEAQRRAGGAK